MAKTIDELKALVAARIAGQGSAIDIGNALPTLFNEILDALGAVPAAQIQSDWNQADNTKVDFIKNKPTIPAAPLVVDGLTFATGEVTVTSEDMTAISACMTSGRPILLAGTDGNSASVATNMVVVEGAKAYAVLSTSATLTLYEIKVGV